MLNNIISFSIKNKLIVGLLVLGLVFYGSYQVTKLPIDAVPDITDNQVQIITQVPSLGAPDVERLITFPLEQANNNIPGLKEIRSFSRFGLSLITIVFEDDVDIYWARQQVTERLNAAQQQIPKGLGLPELAPVTTGLGEIYQYILKPKQGYENKYNDTELRTIQDWIVKRQLTSVKGVADVSSFGGKVKQYEVAVDPQVLRANGITISDVFSALEKNNENTGGSYIEKTATVLYIRSEGLISNLKDISNIVVKNTSNGTPILIKDIADIRTGFVTRYGAVTLNDEGEVVGAVVMMLKGENSSKVIKDVKSRIAQIQQTLPEGVVIEPFLDRTKMVNNAINTVAKNLIEGALIVILILVLFLGNFRAGLIVASVIPLAMLFAIILMNIFGVSGNLMSLGALDFGLIVDGTVIIVEACLFQLHTSKLKKLSQDQMDSMVYDTSTRMRNAAVFGELIILVVYLPIFTLVGIEGKMFKPMAQTVAFALLGAFVLSLTYVPMMTAYFLSKELSHKKNISDKIMEKVENFHQGLLVKIMRFPKLLIGSVITLFVFALLVFSRMGGEFIPELPEGDFAVETRVLTGSNINTTTESVMKAAHVLKAKFPEVEKIVGKIGSGEIPTDPMPMEAADMMIILKDKSKWASAETWEELSSKMSEALVNVPGVTFSFQYPVAMRFNELMTGSKQDVACKIFGENLDTLSKYAKILGKVVGQVDGAKDLYVEPIDGLPQLIISFKREAIAQYGLNIKDINQVINTALAGQSSGLVFEDEKRFDLIVKVAGEKRQELSDIKQLLIATPSGTQIPLEQVANVEIKESVNQIQREDAKRRIIVGFNVEGRDVETVVNDLQDKVTQSIKLPSGYYITYGGAFENLIAAKERLSVAVPISLVLIFVLLYFAFGSVKHSLLIYSAIPLSAIGGVLFLALRGMPFSISAGIGFIALFGVAVLNGIVLIAEYNKLKKEGFTDLTQIVLEGTKHRLRPVLMTALVASLGFLPMALSHGAGAEVQRPLATVVIGGLLIATFLTLFILPVLYVIFEKGIKIKPHTAVVGLLMAVMVFKNQTTQAQDSISLQAAIDSATKNNLGIKNQRLMLEYKEKLKSSAVDLPQINLMAEYGQINSSYLDNRFGIAQSFSFPTVYNRRKKLLNLDQELAQIDIALKTTELKKLVSEVYYLLLMFAEKEIILKENLAIYSQFLAKSKLRFDKGAGNIVELATAETQQMQVQLQLNQLQTDLEVNQIKFQYFINTQKFYQPQAIKENLVAIDSVTINKHPLLTSLAIHNQQAAMATKLEQAKFMPDINLAYSNMTMRGTGSDNVFYTGSKRFNSVQFGVGVPLFYGAQKARVSASKTQELMAQNQLEQGLKQLNSSYLQLLAQYKKQQETVQFMEQVALKNNSLLKSAALQQFNAGEIDYLEWTILMNSVIIAQNNYVEAQNALHQIKIQIEYFTAN
jgi:heavy metal efflux system protein